MVINCFCYLAILNIITFRLHSVSFWCSRGTAYSSLQILRLAVETHYKIYSWHMIWMILTLASLLFISSHWQKEISAVPLLPSLASFLGVWKKQISLPLPHVKKRFVFSNSYKQRFNIYSLLLLCNFILWLPYSMSIFCIFFNCSAI